MELLVFYLNFIREDANAGRWNLLRSSPLDEFRKPGFYPPTVKLEIPSYEDGFWQTFNKNK